MRTQEDVLKWVENSFGKECAADQEERAIRVVEEAIELAQSLRVEMPYIIKILDRVYSRPPGRPGQEIAGCVITLEAVSECLGIDMAKVAEEEWIRISTKPDTFFRAKHREKLEAGATKIPLPRIDMKDMADQIAEEDRQQTEHRPGKYRVLHRGNTVYVKDADFFEEQGGLKEAWGKNWVEIEADSFADARHKGKSLPQSV